MASLYIPPKRKSGIMKMNERNVLFSRLIEVHRPDIFVCGHSHIPHILKVMNDKPRNMLVLNL